jgi:hypothetical protein
LKGFKEFCEGLSKEVCESINESKILEETKSRSFINNVNNRSFNSLNANNSIDYKNSSFKSSSIAEIAGLPPLIISKNQIKAPGLSYRQPNLKQQHRQYTMIYPSKTIKRTSTENNKTSASMDESSSSIQDESFSTQDLKDISNNELLMNSAKRAKM